MSVALDDNMATSVQNRLRTTIKDIRELDSHHILLSLMLDNQNLQALIARRSLDILNLKKGMSVFAHFKATCLDAS